jgi:uncharacterized membrane protein HdeD (DUF308 family)
VGALALGPLLGVYALSSGVALLALSLRVRAWSAHQRAYRAMADGIQAA